jgi:hypothetical protein
MDKTILAGLVSKSFTIRQIAGELKTSYTNVRHWLRVFGLKTRRGPHGRVNNKLRKELKKERDLKPRLCPRCGETDLLKFYGRKTSMCGPCHNLDCIARGKEKRTKMLEYLGGECLQCTYKKHLSSLDIHHLDPTEKDPSSRHWRGWSWSRIEKELQKCIILCKNCHAAVHAGELILGKRILCAQKRAIKSGCSLVAMTLRSGRRDRGFESRHPDH